MKALAHCELIRKELQQLWGANASCEKWDPICQIVIHPSRERYARAAGPGSGQSYGASYIQLNGGKTKRRRIDLLVDANGDITALPHELTHIVLADQFQGRHPPAWLDEGLAMLADSAAKQELHEQDCMTAIAKGRAAPSSPNMRTVSTTRNCGPSGPSTSAQRYS